MADGGIGTTYNLLGRLYAALETAIGQSDLLQVQELQKISARFVDVLLQVGVMPGMKAGFAHIGIDIGPSRLPMMLQGETAPQKIVDFLSQPDVSKWLPVR